MHNLKKQSPTGELRAERSEPLCGGPSHQKTVEHTQSFTLKKRERENVETELCYQLIFH